MGLKIKVLSMNSVCAVSQGSILGTLLSVALTFPKVFKSTVFRTVPSDFIVLGQWSPDPPSADDIPPSTDDFITVLNTPKGLNALHSTAQTFSSLMILMKSCDIYNFLLFFSHSVMEHTERKAKEFPQ